MATLGYGDFDDEAVQTMRLANQSARRLNHDYIDAEHILFGLEYDPILMYVSSLN